MKVKKISERTAKFKKSLADFYNALFFARDISGISSSRFRAFLGGRVMKLVGAIIKFISSTSSRFFGLALVFFGGASLIMHLAKYYLGAVSSISISTAVVSGVIMLLAVPFLISKQPIGIVFEKNKITDFILFEFFAFNRMRKNSTVKTLHPAFGLLLGLIPTVFAYFFPLRYVVLVIVAILFLSVSLISPEFPILSSLLLLPYLDVIPYSGELLAIISIIAFVSFSRKVLVGKRVYSLELSGVVLLVFAVLITVLAFVDGSPLSEKNALILASLILAYIPLSNMIVNRRLAICAVNAIVISMIPIAIGAIIDYLVAIFKGAHAPADFLFSSSECLAAFLMIAALFTAFFVVERSQHSVKALYTVLLGIYVAAIITTECVPAILALLLIFPAYIVIRSLSIPRELLLILAFLPMGIFFLSDAILTRISSFFFAMPDLVKMKAELYESLLLFRDNIFLGIGADSVTADGVGYGGNSISWLLCNFGVFAAALLLIVFLIRMRQFTVFSIYRSSSNVSNFISMGNLAAFVLVVFGMFYNVFADVGIFYLFISAIGVSSAAIRISKREHDDRLGYYGDQRSIDSSAVDVLLRH